MITTRYDIINFLIKTKGYENYLEIGVRNANDCFYRIIAKTKDAVDPNPLFKVVNYPMTSDDFFIQNQNKYDIIFIDGMHTYDQVKRDLANSEKALTSNGTIVLHDCNPPTEWHQRPPKEYDGTGEWNGTTWKALAEARITDPAVQINVVDTDWGIGIVTSGKQKLWNDGQIANCLTYSYFDKHRKEMMNLISVDEFVEIYK